MEAIYVTRRREERGEGEGSSSHDRIIFVMRGIMERGGEKEEKETQRTWERSSPRVYLIRRDGEVRLSISIKRGSGEREKEREREREGEGEGWRRGEGDFPRGKERGIISEKRERREKKRERGEEERERGGRKGEGGEISPSPITHVRVRESIENVGKRGRRPRKVEKVIERLQCYGREKKTARELLSCVGNYFRRNRGRRGRKDRKERGREVLWDQERERERARRGLPPLYIYIYISFSIYFFCVFNDFHFLKIFPKILRNLEKY